LWRPLVRAEFLLRIGFAIMALDALGAARRPTLGFAGHLLKPGRIG